jgi:hypothetical protein
LPETALPSLTRPQTVPWERLAACLALLWLALLPALEAQWRQPGLGAYDEESVAALCQARREGQALGLALGHGTLFNALCVGLCRLLGPSLGCLRLPALLAVLAEGPLLYLWLKPRLGERAALWACLAQWAGTAALLRARMASPPALLPCVFLAHALWLDRLRRPWQHALFGASVCVWLLDYDAWALAAVVLLGWWLWAPARRHPRRALALAAACAAGLALAAAGNAAVLAGLRGAWDFLGPESPVTAQVWGNLAGLLGGGPRLPFSGVGSWPWPAPWIWPLALWGALPALRRWKSLGLLLLAGAAPLAMARTDMEPHRLALLHLGLAAMAGVGAADLWPRRWAPALLAALLALGTVAETRAFWNRDPEACGLAYGRSRNQMAAADWLARHAPAQGWDVVDGLGPWDDAAWRFLLDSRGVPRGPGREVGVLPDDYQPALRGLSATAMEFGNGGGILLVFPDAPGLARMKEVRGWSAPLSGLALRAQPRDLAALCHAWLDAPGHGDPWARTVAWELWLHASLQARQVDLGGVQAMLAEPLVSGWAPDILAHELRDSNPALAQQLGAKAVRVDPRRSGWSETARLARY